MPERVLGRDYVVLKKPGLVYNGATSRADSYIHIGQSLGGGSLACGGQMEDFFLTSREVEVDCPACILKVTS